MKLMLNVKLSILTLALSLAASTAFGMEEGKQEAGPLIQERKLTKEEVQRTIAEAENAWKDFRTAPRAVELFKELYCQGQGGYIVPYRLGTAYYLGRGVGKKDIEAAYGYLSDSSLDQDRYSLYYRGLILSDPTFTQHNLQKALESLKVADQKGVKEAPDQVKRVSELLSFEEKNKGSTSAGSTASNVPTAEPVTKPERLTGVSDSSHRPSLTDLSEDVLEHIILMAGTKSTHGISRFFRAISLGSRQKMGLGSFAIHHDEGNKDLQRGTISLDCFQFVRKLSLVNLRNVKDVSLLGHVQNLTLQYLPSVIDVSGLGGVQTLILQDLQNVTDVSALGGVKNLTLQFFNRITDVSGLGDVQSLTLRDLPGVTDVSALGNVQNLILHTFPRVTDVSALGGVKNLTLHNLPRVTDVSALSGVKNLILQLLSRIIDVSALGNVQNLTLHFLENVTDVSVLGNVQTLILEDLPGVTDVSGLGGVQNLTLLSLNRVTNVSALSGVKNLTLGHLPSVTDVSTISNVQSLTLQCLWGITDVSSLRTVHTLTLNNLPKVTDVSALGTGRIQNLTLRQFSRNITGIEELRKRIPNLHIIDPR